MRLYFICEYRFVRCPDGRIYSPDGVFGPRLFGRYLRIFDRVTVVARVAATSVPCDPALCCESRHVDFLPLPDCRGIGGYLRAGGCCGRTSGRPSIPEQPTSAACRANWGR